MDRLGNDDDNDDNDGDDEEMKIMIIIIKKVYISPRCSHKLDSYS
jgi:hypothetical protein